MCIIDESYFGSQKSWRYVKRPAINWDPITKDEYNEALYEVTYYAYLKRIIKNTSCQGEMDTLNLRRYTRDFPPQSGIGGYDRMDTYTGCFEYETIGVVDNNPEGYVKMFMVWHNVEWTAIKEGVTTHGKDSVFLEAGGLDTLAVYY